MKCPMCGGDGITDKFTPNVGRCIKCNGTGEIEVTNEEYIRSCSFDELAEFLTEVVLSDRRFRMTMVGGVEETKAWLKEKHNA